jgi:23S rRNA pseudouridine2605 synthase
MLGFCSRKQAEQLIAAGRVRVGGKPVLWPVRRIDPKHDVVTVDGRRVRDLAEATVIALHKPRGYITTRSEPGGRPTVYTLLEGVSRWLFPVGRLDRDSSGLLIFTNDHRLGERLTNPVSHVSKTYHVRVRGLPDAAALQVLRDGVRLEDASVTRQAQVRPLGSPSGESTWLEIVLTEGKNRQVRRMCAAVGHEVLELVRVRIGALALGALAPGEWRQLTPEEVAALGVCGSC